MDNDSTRNGGRLSLQERARLGLLVEEPELLLSEPELLLSEVLALEYPTDPAARKAIGAVIRSEIEFGDLPVRREIARRQVTVCRPLVRPLGSKAGESRRPPPKPETVESVIFWIGREHYRAWRAQCPASLLSPLSKIHKWLGATPATESIPPIETSLPEPARPASVTKGVIALVEAENAALVALRKELKREPDFDEFWDYLTTKDETGTVADSNDVSLQWIGKSNRPCSTAKSTFRNRLTAAKKRNPFTPS